MDTPTHLLNITGILSCFFLPLILYYVWRDLVLPEIAKKSIPDRSTTKGKKKSNNKKLGVPELSAKSLDGCARRDIISKFVTNYSSLIQTPYIIGICGGSGSGKTFIAELIVETIAEMYPSTYSEEITVISQDSYYRGGNTETNYDIPSSIDFDLLVEHLETLIKGKPIDCPIYDFTTHSRRKETIKLFPKKIIIVEGILILTQEKLRDLFNIKVFVNADISTQIFRRTKRDMQERGRSLDEISDRYERHVAPSYNEFVLPSAKHADMSINNFKGCFVGPQIMLNHIITIIKNIGNNSV